MARDPKVAARTNVMRRRAAVIKLDGLLNDARRAYRASLAAAAAAGVSKEELARMTGTSASRIRQEIGRETAESAGNR
jgi:phosphoglycolate phosphatase-like HAD superfamily hydrolase